MSPQPNHYERAFEHWLIDHRLEYVPLNQLKEVVCAHAEVKSFDFLVCARSGMKILAEVKGRKFRGTSLQRRTALPCWVTTRDIDALTTWQQIFGRGYLAVLVFVYRLEHVDVELDGIVPFEFNDAMYIFYCISLDDYRQWMRARSPRWRTVTLSADGFRRCAVPIDRVFLSDPPATASAWVATPLD